MKKNKVIFLICFLVLFCHSLVVFAQDTINDNVTEEIISNIDTGRQILREISIDTFDDPTRWSVEMPIDRGVVTSRRFIGSPSEKQPIRAAEQINGYTAEDNYVYGIRADYFGRSMTQIFIRAVRPLYVPGVAKKISVWVAGREKNHNLSIVLQDMNGKVKKLPLGKLGYSGWKRFEATVPVSIDQEDKLGALNGLYIKGFIIDTKFEDTVGRYYAYFDDIRAISDVIDESYNNNEDNISDGW